MCLGRRQPDPANANGTHRLGPHLPKNHLTSILYAPRPTVNTPPPLTTGAALGPRAFDILVHDAHGLPELPSSCGLIGARRD